MDANQGNFDFARFEQFATGNSQQLKRIIDLFRGTLTEALQAARAADSAGDAAKLKRAAHDLKNCFLLVAAREACERASTMEELALRGEFDKASAYLPSLETAAESIEKALDERLAQAGL